MKLTTLPAHPYLIAIALVCSAFINNINRMPPVDVFVPLGVVVLFAALALLLFRFVYSSFHRAALACTLLIIAFFFYTDVREFLSSITQAAATGFGITVDHIRHRYLFAAWGGVVLLLMYSIARIRFDEARITQTVNCFAAFLIVTCGVRTGMSAVKIVNASPLPSADTRIVSTNKAHAPILLKPPGRCPHIYYLVFDRYASNRVLAKYYGFDNSTFYADLEKRGFFCANNSRANYPATVVSMSSALNMKYHEDPNGTELQFSKELQDFQVSRILKNLGYEYYHFGNWYFAFTHNRHADFNFTVSRLPSEFAALLLHMTPVQEFLAPRQGDPNAILRQFSGIAKVAPRNRPTFVYAHFICPHPPFVFDSQGPVKNRSAHAKLTRDEKYIEQLKFTNDKILQLVDTILSDSDVDPVIVIQSDEGPKVDRSDAALSRADVMDIRTGIITAIHLPSTGHARQLPSTMSPVNTFRFIFNDVFEANFEILDNRVYFGEKSTVRTGQGGRYGFVDVTQQIDKKESAAADVQEDR